MRVGYGGAVYETIELERRDGAAVIRLNRPAALNAWNTTLGEELLDAVQTVAADDAVRAVCVTGAGRAFSSGADLRDMASRPLTDAGHVDVKTTLTTVYHPLLTGLRTMPKPVLAAINGVAAGAGTSLALACDFRIASEKAKLVLAFIKVGLVPDSGGVWFLTRMIGASRAWELAATGDPLSAEDAAACGIVHRLVSVDEFEGAWRAWAEELAAGPTRAYALTKQLVNNATAATLDDQLDLEVDAQTQAGATADHLEGVQAFLGKRRPEFKGL